jgi:hypothetical protein
MIDGSRMQYRPDKGYSVHDFDLKYSNGTVAAVEVTTSVNEQMKGTEDAIWNKKRGGLFVLAKKCRNGWWVHPLLGASVKKIRAHADEYLAAIEAEGRHQFSAGKDANTSAGVARIWQDLGIEAGDVV